MKILEMRPSPIRVSKKKNELIEIKIHVIMTFFICIHIIHPSNEAYP